MAVLLDATWTASQMPGIVSVWTRRPTLLTIFLNGLNQANTVGHKLDIANVGKWIET